MFVSLGAMIAFACSLVCALALGGVLFRMRGIARKLPVVDGSDLIGEWPADETVSVIIPAFNEEERIGPTVRAVLKSTPSPHVEVIVVDDRSSDRTAAVVDAMTASDSRLRLLHGEVRPAAEVVLGKNWACAQGARVATGRLLLFVDADLTLRPGCIEAAVRLLREKNAALLGIMPEKELRLACEWIVEPQLTILHLTSPWLAETSVPEKSGAFTPGWFMLFEREVYDRIGGHWGVRNKVLEDLALGERTKAAGGRVTFALAPAAARLHLYDSWREMREGYTKNFFCSEGHRVPAALAAAFLILLLFAGPWLALIAGLCTPRSPWTGWAVGMAVAGIALQFLLRLELRRTTQIPIKRFWLMPVGGLVLAWINLRSMILHLSGGVTWKGRAIPRH